MMNDHIITAAPDLNGDGEVSGIDSTGGYALYYNSRASMPNAGISTNGEIYLSFSGYTETADNGTQVFRHIYITKSSDGGTTWKDPVDVTPHTIYDGQQECVFGSMNPVVDDKIRIVYQKDPEPGLAVRGDEDMVDLNYIIYLEIDTAGLFTTNFLLSTWNCDSPNNCSDPGTEDGTYATYNACMAACAVSAIDEEIAGLLIYPNPAKNTLTIDGNYTSATIYNIFGKLVLTTDYQKTIDVATLSNGIYFIKVDSTTIKFIKQ